MPEAGVGDVLELLLKKPDLVWSGICEPEEARGKRKRT
eukprot:CAMPEP_0197431890 /NCGR_PEP_ID=MMETSP1175-20131217/45_1 /TAXON_ID=1003142 /ORGANISM="Triceratium dubium, Strain CCMP147" /LENGTH=37 /DNA_ID= /DNA_START= /DNA_END= /DNA_ORIENTATION=